jgi:GT2 family glycosyltransferase
LILLHDEPDKINSSGNRHHFLGIGHCGGYKADLRSFLEQQSGESAHPGLQNPVPKLDCWYPTIGYAMGATVLYSSKALKEVGLLDEDIFLYLEDLDLSWRIRLWGYQVVLAPQSRVLHKYSFVSRNPRKFYFMERNRLLVSLKNYKWQTLVLLAPAFLLMEVGMLFYALANGFLREKWRSYPNLLRLVPSILTTRRVVQANRKISDQEVVRHCVDRMEFADLMSPLLRKVTNAPFVVYWWLVRRLIFW